MKSCSLVEIACAGILAWCLAHSTFAQEKLLDGDFEASSPTGVFPDSGCPAMCNWQPASAGGGAGALCITTSAHSGTNVIHQFTGVSANEWWTAPFQEVSALTGDVLRARAWIRTPPGFSWVNGSQARIRLNFLGAGTNVLATHASSSLASSNTAWNIFEVTTAPAPVGTTRARFICELMKPAGSSGVTVAEFDDCSLLDPEESLANGGFEFTRQGAAGPFLSNWFGAWLGEAGAVAIKPADESDRVLWQFTGNSSNDWWVAIYQQMDITPGTAFRARASLRTPAGEPWVNGSEAFFRIIFLNASNAVLASHGSEVVRQPNANWSRFEVNTGPAPPTSARVRFTCYLRKPPGSNGLSVANFDDCSLVEVAVPGARVSSRAVGVTASQTQTSIELRNTGKAPLIWNVVETIPWLSGSPTNGTIPPLTASNIVLTINRAGVIGTGTIKESFTLQTNDRDIPVDVYMEMPAPALPVLPAHARFYGAQLRVRDRLADGSLSDPYHYVIKGTAWSPASMGTPAGPFFRRQEFAKWYVADIQLHRAMNANTVYTFLDFGLDQGARDTLDYCYKNGIKAIVTVDEDGTANSNRLQQVITAYRNHPAVLAWAIGNEWNINFFHHTFSNLLDSANAAEALARQAKALDTNHPVLAIFGDIDIPGLNPLRKADENSGQPISTERIVNDLCPSVDGWGLNIYRGTSFANLFSQWASITAKPMFFSEFGTDAYRIAPFDVFDGAEDESMQAAFNRGLWQETVAHLSALDLTNQCLGGTVFSWNDEWWKARAEHGASIDAQENLGYYGGQPDGFANEEWFGIVGIDRRRRESYFNFQGDFSAVLTPADLDLDSLPDSWEYRVIDFIHNDGLRTLGDVLPTGDFDNDGASNVAEYLADTDPANPSSVLRLTNISPLNQKIRLHWSGGVGATQYLERAGRPHAGGWLIVYTNRPPTSTSNQYEDMPGEGRGFYRLRAVK